MGPQKNTLADKKMAYLAAGGNPVGVGKGRGVCLWGILTSLSLVMCQTINRHAKNSTSPMKQSLSDKCGECSLIVPRKTNLPAYPAPADCTNGEENRYCTFNGTWYARSKLDGKIICYDLKVRYENGQPETLVPNIQKRNANQVPILTCN